MSAAVLVLGDQLVKGLPGLPSNAPVFMQEDWELCTRTRHHKQKVLLFLSAMDHFRHELAADGRTVEYRGLIEEGPDLLAALADWMKQSGHSHLWTYTPHDPFFRKQLSDWALVEQIDLQLVSSPLFITSPADWSRYRGQRKRLLMADFYKEQRQRTGYLVGPDRQPLGEKWSFDEENRKPLPKGILPPPWLGRRMDAITQAKAELVEKLFPHHPGSIEGFSWPVTRQEALEELDQFIQERLNLFGPYEDSLSQTGGRLWHSALSPSINMGLLLPGECCEAAIAAYEKGEASLTSVEGFVRQLIGWREFIYQMNPEYEGRDLNQLGHNRRMTDAWWKGETGLPPLDGVIRRLNERAWCHHIERLMVLGSSIVMAEIHPDDAYRWFMEMFIDSADWVMAPNVYGMSQFADGGLFATKPYICGSSYLLKMGDYPKGPWTEIWDGLYWRFVDRHRSLFEANPRMRVMLGSLEKMDSGRKAKIFGLAESWVEKVTIC